MSQATSMEQPASTSRAWARWRAARSARPAPPAPISAALEVGEPAAQRLQQPRATVGACTAAHPHNDAFGTRLNCDPDELASPARCRVERIEWGGPEAP